MRAAGLPDSLTVINGPEDGAEFPIVRTPVAIGQNPGCSVQIRLDRSVQPVHVSLNTVSSGYRIRSASNAPVHVNGKRAGKVRSRIARSGDVIRIGHTELVLECAPDGLAGRSRGISTDGDFVFSIKTALSGIFNGSWRLIRSIMRFPLYILRTKKLMFLILFIGLYNFVPAFHFFVIFVIEFVQGLVAFTFSR